MLVEFKNYDTEDIGKDEVNQTRNYLTKPMGRLAILVTNKAPGDAAHVKRNSIFSEDKKVILFITTQQLIEMLDIKERGEDPADLIMDAVERFTYNMSRTTPSINETYSRPQPAPIRSLRFDRSYSE